MGVARSSILTSVCLLFLPAAVFAHATPVEYQPAASSAVASAPHDVRIRFSERVERGASELTILGPDGSPVHQGTASVGPDPRTLARSLGGGAGGVRTTATGAYTVAWQVISADDGHFTKGAFTFFVGERGASAAGSSAGISIRHETPFLQVFAIWLELLGHAVVLGSVAVVGCMYAVDRKKLRSLIAAGSACAFGGAVLYLLAQTAEIAATRGNSWVAIVPTVAATTAGSYAVLRLGVAALLAAVLLWRPRQKQIRWVALLLLVILAILRARVSHAAASPFLPVLSVAINALHLLGKELWIGLLIAFVMLVLPQLMWEGNLQHFIRASSALAVRLSIALALAGASGAYIVWLHLKSVGNIAATHWGTQTLYLTGLALIFLLLRLHHQLIVLPAARRLSAEKEHPADHVTADFFWIPLTFEMFIGIAVLYLSSVLIITTPPVRSFRFLEHTTHSQGVTIILEEDPYDEQSLRIHFSEPALTALTVTLTETEKGIGPMVVEPERRFPGGYAIPLTAFSPPGLWTIDVTARRANAYDAVASFQLRYAGELQRWRMRRTSHPFKGFALMMLGMGGVFVLGGLLLIRKVRGEVCAMQEHQETMPILHAFHPLPSRWTVVLTLLIETLIVISLAFWFSTHEHSVFQGLCTREGDTWGDGVPMRRGTITLSLSVPGCSVHTPEGDYHIGDIREYLYLKDTQR